MASFDENGKYIKTNWKAGDKITATKLNKIEESIEAVNDNDISRHVEADARLDALEAKDVAHDKEFTNIKNTIADNKAAAELGDYDINSRMTFLENELNEGIEEVHNVAETVDGKIAQAEANMAVQVNQGKADMEAMVAEVEADLDGLHAKDDELSEQLAHIENHTYGYVNIKEFGAKGDGITDDTSSIQSAINYAIANNKSVLISDGTYCITNLKVNIPEGQKFNIHGNGGNSVLKKISNTESVALDIEVNKITNTATNVTIENFKIQSSYRIGTGLKLTNCVGYRISNLTVNYFGTGIKTENSYVGHINTVNLWSNLNGLDLGITSNAIKITQIDTTQCADIGIILRGYKQITIDTPVIQGCKCGIAIIGEATCRGLSIINPYFEENTLCNIATGITDTLELNDDCSRITDIAIQGICSYAGSSPSKKIFWLNNIDGFYVENIDCDSNLDIFNLGENVYNIKIDNNRQMGNNLLKSKNSIKNNLGYLENKNIIINGEMKGIKAPFRTSLSYEMDGSKAIIEVPSDSTDYYIEFWLNNPGQYGQMVFNLSMNNFESLTNCQLIYYGGDSPIYSNLANGDGITFCIRSNQIGSKSSTRFALRVRNTTNEIIKLELLHAFLTKLNDVNVYQNANDVLCGNSGSVFVNTSKTEVTIATPYETYYSRILISKGFFGDVKVTKNVGDNGKSFKLNVTFSGGDTQGMIDYLIIPDMYI